MAAIIWTLVFEALKTCVSYISLYRPLKLSNTSTSTLLKICATMWMRTVLGEFNNKSGEKITFLLDLVSIAPRHGNPFGGTRTVADFGCLALIGYRPSACHRSLVRIISIRLISTSLQQPYPRLYFFNSKPFIISFSWKVI